MGKYSVYAVAQGSDPVTHENVYDLKFYSWGECSPYVGGARFARYKGFMSEAEADAWLARERNKRQAYPALKIMEEEITRHSRFNETLVQPSTRYDMTNSVSDTSSPMATIAGTAKKDSKEMLSDDIKFKFSSKCMDLGLDPNVILLHLMGQWLSMAEVMNLGIRDDTDDDDDIPPW